MKKGIGKTISVIAILTMTFQLGMPIIPVMQTKVLAADITIPVETENIQPTASGEVSTELSESANTTEEISRNYEIKDEETWDVSKNEDGSVIAKWTLENRTLTIPGTGEMKDWNNNSDEDWHNSQYMNLIENVIIEEGITSIGSFAFEGCSSLKEINIPEGVTSIGKYAFKECSSLINITIPEGVTSIGESTFEECSGLESINMPEGVTSIGSNAFYGCSSLTNITIPDGVTSIGGGAFINCSNLTNITIPEGVTSIGRAAFSGCSNLESINVNENNLDYVSENGILYNKEKTEIIKYPEGRKDLKYTILEGVTSIEEYAFEECSNLESIVIPESVTSIGRAAFEACSGLKSIVIPESLTSIESYVFGGCSGLESIVIPKSVTSIKIGAFYRCSSLMNITIPEGVTSIGSSVFSNCSSLANITIPEGVTSIGQSAFEGCSSLINITIPEGVTSIGSRAFHGCTGLTNITIPEGVTSIEETTFYGCSNLESIVIPESVTSIGMSAFNGCSSLTNITIPEGVISIGDYTFSGCSSLILYVKADSLAHKYAEQNKIGYILEGEATEISTKYEIKNEETWDISENGDGRIIAKWTFEDRTLNISGTGKMKDYMYYSEEDWHNTPYTNLINTVVIEEGVTNIGNYAFYKCKNLKNINISNDVIDIGKNAFEECSNLESIILPGRLTAIQFGVFRGCSSLISITIPEIVESIESNAFNGCNNLTDIDVDINNTNYISENGILFNKDKTKIVKYPEGRKDLKYTILKGVTSIGENAFYGCSNLESIVISESVTSIGRAAFEACSGLKSIVIPESLASIESYVFNGCINLTNITIPEGVTSIGSGVFEGCSNLTNITIPEGVTSIGSGVFEGCSNLTNITIPEGVISIGDRAFDKCSSLTNITIPKGVTIIGESVFYGCNSLANIAIPEGVTSIGKYAFYECSSLTNITIPEGVTSIGESAFYGCNSLTNITIPKRVTVIEDYAIDKKTVICVKSNTNGHKYAEENKQGYIIDDEGPTVTFTPNAGENIQKEYSVKIQVQDNMEEVGVNENSLKYQWTQSETEPTKESFIEGFENGETITKNTGDGKWYLWIYAEDNLENERITRSDAFNFDNTAPIVNIEYSTKEITEDPVIVTITSNEEIQEVEGWTLSSDEKVLTKEYSENTNETIIIKDLVGNEIQAIVEIINIGKIEIGDINQDGRIDVTDLLMLKRHLVAGSRTEWRLTGRALLLADMNEDRNVDVTDMLMLKRKIVENI